MEPPIHKDGSLPHLSLLQPKSRRRPSEQAPCSIALEQTPAYNPPFFTVLSGAWTAPARPVLGLFIRLAPGMNKMNIWQRLSMDIMDIPCKCQSVPLTFLNIWNDGK